MADDPFDASALRPPILLWHGEDGSRTGVARVRVADLQLDALDLRVLEAHLVTALETVREALKRPRD